MNKQQLEQEVLKALLDDDYIRVPVELAAAIGLNEAIVLRKFHEWVKSNTKREETKYFHDGYFWTVFDYGRLHKEFPFWSERTIQRICLNLEKGKLLVSTQKNKHKRDLTKWYRPNLNAVLGKYLEYKAQKALDDDKLASSTSRQLGAIHDDKLASSTSRQVGAIHDDKLASTSIYSITKDSIAKDSIAKEPPLTPQGEPRAEDSLCSQEEVIQNLSFSDNQAEDLVKQHNLSLEQEVPPPALKTSAKDEQMYSLFYEVYLAEKPSNFVEHKALTAVAKKKVKFLVKEFRDKSQDKFVAALIYVREQKDGWWRQSPFSLDNLMSNGKIESFADKHEWFMENDQAYRDRVEGKAPSMDVARNQVLDLKETSVTTKPSNALDFSGWLNHQHDIVYRQDYLKSASLAEFYNKRSYLKEWHEFAKANFDYDWRHIG